MSIGVHTWFQTPGSRSAKVQFNPLQLQLTGQSLLVKTGNPNGRDLIPEVSGRLGADPEIVIRKSAQMPGGGTEGSGALPKNRKGFTQKPPLILISGYG